MKITKNPFFISVIVDKEDYNILYTDTKTIGHDIVERIKTIDKKYRSFDWESKEWKIVNIAEYRKLIEKAENDYQGCMQMRIPLDSYDSDKWLKEQFEEEKENSNGYKKVQL